MLGFSIIGIPDGFQISSINLNRQLPLEGKVALDTTIINIFPETDILMVWREVEKDFYRHYFVYYRYATEIDRTRTGTYYGSVVTIENRIASPTGPLIAALTDLADVVRQQCLTEDSRFHRNITGLEFKLPDSVRKLTANLEKAELFEGNYNKSGFFPIGDNEELTNYNHFIYNVFNNPLLSDFRILYASEHNEVLNRVKEKNILKILSVSKLVEAKEQEVIVQQQREQERIKEQERKEREAKLQKELQEKQDALLRQSSKMPTPKELPAKFMNLESRVEDLERRFKMLSEKVNGGNSTPNLFYRLLEKIESKSWATFLIGLFSLLIVTALLIWYFSSPSEESKSNSTANTTTSKPTSTQTLSATKNPIAQSYNSEEKIQLNYQRSLNEVIKVKDLISLIKTKCNLSCPDTEEAIAESILRINTSIKKKDPMVNIETVLDFELKDITGTVTFEVSRCCDLSKTDPANFKLNAKNP